VYYQPQLAISGGALVGAEALLRWAHGLPAEISPADFVPLAEETGLIVPIGEWVLRTACAQCKAWRDAGAAGLRIAVNLSPRQFREKGLVSMLARVLADTGLAAAALELELTESLVMDDVDAAIATMREVRAMGVGISIDDFGIGHSSLSYLKRFPIDGLKIDRSFVRDIASTIDGSAAIVQAIVQLAHSMRLRVMAEGVESSAQLECLRQFGCDAYQGFMVSAAVPAEAFRKNFLSDTPRAAAS
jgi:EAL domain-containing protein (putative c-di-GMP-specific phosphodiesterase class I)